MRNAAVRYDIIDTITNAEPEHESGPGKPDPTLALSLEQAVTLTLILPVTPRLPKSAGALCKVMCFNQRHLSAPSEATVLRCGRGRTLILRAHLHLLSEHLIWWQLRPAQCLPACLSDAAPRTRTPGLRHTSLSV